MNRPFLGTKQKNIKKLPKFFRKPLNKIFILQSRRSLR